MRLVDWGFAGEATRWGGRSQARGAGWHTLRLCQLRFTFWKPELTFHFPGRLLKPDGVSGVLDLRRGQPIELGLFDDPGNPTAPLSPAGRPQLRHRLAPLESDDALTRRSNAGSAPKRMALYL